MPEAHMPMTTALTLPGMAVSENLGVCYGLVGRRMGLYRRYDGVVQGPAPG